nr:uncharacterized protein LOC128686716 [Cherax quadricarinatus]
MLKRPEPTLIDAAVEDQRGQLPLSTSLEYIPVAKTSKLPHFAARKEADDLTEAVSGNFTQAFSGDPAKDASGDHTAPGDLPKTASGDLTEAVPGDLTEAAFACLTEDTRIRVVRVKIRSAITKPKGIARIFFELGRLLTHSKQLPFPENSDELEYSRTVQIEGSVEKSRYQIKIKITCWDKASRERVTCWVSVDTGQRFPEKEEVDLLVLWLLDCVTCQNYSEKDITDHLKTEVMSFYRGFVQALLGGPTFTIIFDQDSSGDTSGEVYRKPDAAQRDRKTEVVGLYRKCNDTTSNRETSNDDTTRQDTESDDTSKPDFVLRLRRPDFVMQARKRDADLHDRGPDFELRFRKPKAAQHKKPMAAQHERSEAAQHEKKPIAAQHERRSEAAQHDRRPEADHRDRRSEADHRDRRSEAAQHAAAQHDKRPEAAQHDRRPQSAQQVKRRPETAQHDMRPEVAHNMDPHFYLGVTHIRCTGIEENYQNKLLIEADINHHVFQETKKIKIDLNFGEKFPTAEDIEDAVMILTRTLHNTVIVTQEEWNDADFQEKIFNSLMSQLFPEDTARPGIYGEDGAAPLMNEGVS